MGGANSQPVTYSLKRTLDSPTVGSPTVSDVALSLSLLVLSGVGWLFRVVTLMSQLTTQDWSRDYHVTYPVTTTSVRGSGDSTPQLPPTNGQRYRNMVTIATHQQQHTYLS